MEIIFSKIDQAGKELVKLYYDDQLKKICIDLDETVTIENAASEFFDFTTLLLNR
jgi:hypothetical protein